MRTKVEATPPRVVLYPRCATRLGDVAWVTSFEPSRPVRSGDAAVHRWTASTETGLKGQLLRPTRGTVAVVAIGLGFAAVAAIAFSGLRPISDRSTALARRDLPALEALNAAAAALATSNAQLEAALAISDPAAQGAALAQVSATTQVKDAAWAKFEAVAIDSEAASALQNEYLTVDQAARALGSVLISSNPTDPAYAANLAAERAAAAREGAILDRLQNEFYGPTAQATADAIVAKIRFARTWVVAGFVLLWVGAITIALAMMRSARREQDLHAAEQSAHAAAVRRSDLETRLQRGLQMVAREDSAYGIINQALGTIGGGTAVEVLVADSSRAHFRQACSTGADDASACRVGDPQQCPAASSGQARVFTDSTNLDACPWLRDHPSPVWATCVPISMAGRTTGVIHAEGPVAEPPSPALLPELELVAQKAGDRIGALRILARTEFQAQVDPLTGLPNRRTLENRSYETLGTGLPYVVAYLDLDHFKILNDTYGHDTGDRALRLFARVLRDNVRPRDIPARYGGEEFVVVLPDCTLPDAATVVERIRTQLTAALASGVVPNFTVSAGLALSDAGEPLPEAIARADSLLLRAKALGRDRIVTSIDPADTIAATSTNGVHDHP